MCARKWSRAFSLSKAWNHRSRINFWYATKITVLREPGKETQNCVWISFDKSCHQRFRVLRFLKVRTFCAASAPALHWEVRNNDHQTKGRTHDAKYKELLTKWDRADSGGLRWNDAASQSALLGIGATVLIILPPGCSLELQVVRVVFNQNSHLERF